jgi:hypothetical protein
MTYVILQIRITNIILIWLAGTMTGGKARRFDAAST